MSIDLNFFPFKMNDYCKKNGRIQYLYRIVYKIDFFPPLEYWKTEATEKRFPMSSPKLHECHRDVELSNLNCDKLL